MKSIYKRVLLIGLSLSLIALAGLQSAKSGQIDSENDDNSDGQLPAPEDASTEKLGPIPVPSPSPRPRLSTAPEFFSATKVTFTGKLVRDGHYFALQEMAGALYTLDSIAHPLPPLGEEIRVTGRLDLAAGRLHVDDIERFIARPRFFPRAAGQ